MGGLIKVVNNFITKDEASHIISFIDNNMDLFHSKQENTRHTLMFGKDFLFPESSEDFSKNNPLCDYFKDKIFPPVIKLLEDTYHDLDIAVSNLWFSRHDPGSKLPLHEDIDNGANLQFKYSAILYLNSLENTGILKFPFANFEYSPSMGDLVFFPSKGKTFAHQIDTITEKRYCVPMWISSKKYSF